MEGSWEGFLDIIDLNQDTRQKAELKTLIEFPLAQPKKDLLIGLFDCITSIYGSEKSRFFGGMNQAALMVKT
ncbi:MULTISPECIES: hypothetical protein [Sutcliffiella]|uniref:hypothetical protein n=1 Tax=Sutcliffiella TaxID=2837511 RepID=UPI001CBE18D5|nr:hypothetical protein [Sutcliffiella horikoshii]UAL46438.1 hypothetical protein K7887_16180 [Sutcliffiella horikoshii]